MVPGFLNVTIWEHTREPIPEEEALNRPITLPMSIRH